MSDKEWGEAHRREAIALFCEVARDTILRGGCPRRALDGALGGWSVESEERFSRYLTYLDGFGRNATVDAAVRLVRDLAEGRKVRERGYRVGDVRFMHTVTGDDSAGDAQDRAAARELATARGARVIRVTRIRKV